MNRRFEMKKIHLAHFIDVSVVIWGVCPAKGCHPSQVPFKPLLDYRPITTIRCQNTPQQV